MDQKAKLCLGLVICNPITLETEAGVLQRIREQSERVPHWYRRDPMRLQITLSLLSVSTEGSICETASLQDSLALDKQFQEGEPAEEMQL